jgi:hypothetical protein
LVGFQRGDGELFFIHGNVKLFSVLIVVVPIGGAVIIIIVNCRNRLNLIAITGHCQVTQLVFSGPIRRLAILINLRIR